jgi:hypothetical protein
MEYALNRNDAQLGHSAPEITREIYLHAIPENNVAQLKAWRGLYLDPNWTKFGLQRRSVGDSPLKTKK